MLLATLQNYSPLTQSKKENFGLEKTLVRKPSEPPLPQKGEWLTRVLPAQLAKVLRTSLSEEREWLTRAFKLVARKVPNQFLGSGFKLAFFFLQKIKKWLRQEVGFRPFKFFPSLTQSKEIEKFVGKKTDLFSSKEREPHLKLPLSILIFLIFSFLPLSRFYYLPSNFFYFF